MKKVKVSKQTVWYVIFVIAWAFVAMVASQFVIAFPMSALLGEQINQPIWICIYDALVYLLALALVLFVPPKLYHIYMKSHNKTDSSKSLQAELSTNVNELGVQHAPTMVDIGLAPIGYVVYIVFANMLTTIMGIFSWFNAEEAQNVGFSYGLTGMNRIIAMIALVLIAPVAEEIVMRGWLYGKLRSKLKIPLAILLVSVLFGLLHGQWNVAVSTFALSVVLCGLREITGTIWAGMLLHILSNGIAFYLLYVANFML